MNLRTSGTEVPWSVTHPLASSDKNAVAAMRTMLEPMKGGLRGTKARPAFDDIFNRVPSAADATYETDVVGGVPGWWCRLDGADSEKAVLYLHGGCYVMGSAKSFRHFVGHIAARAKASAFVADYRLAPEHPFPAAVEDAQAAYRGLGARGVRRIAIAGDSAGGGLGLVLLSLVMTKADRPDGIRPAGMVGFSPWTDLMLTGRSWEDRAAADPIFVHDQMAEFARLYLGDHDPSDPLASPLYGNLAGLPPIRVHVGEDEVLLDDARRYVAKAVAAGEDARLEVWQGMMHVFPSSIGHLSAAEAALAATGAFLTDRLSMEPKMLAS
jgi:monoterpene epsilon-lactone hydrolase